ncbi:MAG: nitroreductase family protein [Spirochaetes bacterium]|nr:nitroreductase family protein [Spirochaetota bacterium]
MTSVFELINTRSSVRAYSPEPIPAAALEELLAFMQGIKKGPFGSALRFEFLDESAAGTAEHKKLGTYGMITGDRYYIAGAVQKGPMAELDYGYCMERIILKATELGLGTCWLGGTLNRSSFTSRINLAADEITPAVSPVGVPAELKRLKIILVQKLIQARKRKDFASLFFNGDASRPLAKDLAGRWATVLEAVQSGPSASNKQPWRIIRMSTHFHVCLDYDPLYNKAFSEFAIQKLDIGIALCHFEAAARELQLPGSWEQLDPAPDCGKFQYQLSWRYDQAAAK